MRRFTPGPRCPGRPPGPRLAAGTETGRASFSCTLMKPVKEPSLFCRGGRRRGGEWGTQGRAPRSPMSPPLSPYQAHEEVAVDLAVVLLDALLHLRRVQLGRVPAAGFILREGSGAERPPRGDTTRTAVALPHQQWTGRAGLHQPPASCPLPASQITAVSPRQPPARHRDGAGYPMGTPRGFGAARLEPLMSIWLMSISVVPRG